MLQKIKPSSSEDLTIADLGKKDQRLGLKCNYCSRFRYMATHRFPPETCVKEIAASLHCARCCSDDVETFPVTRNSENGYWPAESS